MRHFITLDVESPYSTADKYTLKHLTYEPYIRDERFRVNGLGYKVDADDWVYVYGEDKIRATLAWLFPPGNDNVMIGHNVMFDGAVCAWVYGAYAAAYYCTQSMSRALWNQQPSSLESLAIRCFPRDKAKRKGKELQDFDGVLRELTDAEQAVLGGYCGNDVELTFECFKMMWKWFPEDSFRIMDIALQMFIRPGFELDRPRVEQYVDALEVHQNELVDKALEYIDPLYLLLARSKITPKQAREQATPRDAAKKFLGSNDQFAQWILDQGIPLQQVHSPTPTNPGNMKWPLAKNAEEFIDIQTEYPELTAVWDARISVKSSIERAKAQRMLDHSQVSHINPDGLVPMPLQFAAAHTLRFGGTNKLNPLNFGRGSELRKSLRAPKGYLLGIADLSNIERRKVAWLVGETSVIRAYAEGQDLYCNFASDAFKRPISKKEDPDERHVGKVCELQLIYRAGAYSLRRTLATGALGGPRLHFAHGECQHFVDMFRRRNPKNKLFWEFCDRMLVAMCMKGTREEFGPLVFETERIAMPNGHYINYPGLQAEEGDFGYDFTYWNGQFRKHIHGGIITNNVVQYLAQALLWCQMLRIQEFLDTIGGRIILQVHDEIILLLPAHIAEQAMEYVLSLMKEPAWWCNDGSLILDAEGDVDDIYSK